MERRDGDRPDRTQSIPDDLDMFVRTAALPVVRDLHGGDTRPLPVTAAVVVVPAARKRPFGSGHRVGRRPVPARRSIGSRRSGPRVLAGALAALTAGLVLTAVMGSGPAVGAPTATTAATVLPQSPAVAPTGVPIPPPVPDRRPVVSTTPAAVKKKPAATSRRESDDRRREKPETGRGGRGPGIAEWFDFVRILGGRSR